jgi:hypothetical protein
VPDGFDLNDREKVWIAYGRAAGWRLTNHTDGGFGMHGHRFSEDHKAKLSAVNKGKRLSTDTKKKIGLAMGRPVVHVGTGIIYRSTKEAAEKLDLQQVLVSRVARGGQRQTKGHVFRYVSSPPSALDQVGLSA